MGLAPAMAQVWAMVHTAGYNGANEMLLLFLHAVSMRLTHARVSHAPVGAWVRTLSVHVAP